MNIVILGLSVTSSWGNGHATTYRSLVRGLAARGHRLLFLERDMPWYAGNRDMPQPPGTEVALYRDFSELPARFEPTVERADLVIVGSFVPEGKRVGEWATTVAKGVTAFYDIDTPITLAMLESGACDYLSPELIPRYRLYLSFTGGPTLGRIESRYGSPMARVLHCSVDPDQYRPADGSVRWDLGYLGTYSADRQPALDRLLVEPACRWSAGRFAVVGPMYPAEIAWPANVARTIHLSPREHPGFYAQQRYTLNITRAVMIAAGFSPSVRLFEAGACGVPILSDYWNGLETLFRPGREILIVDSADDVLRRLFDTPDEERRAIGARARRRILAGHTPFHRATQLECYFQEAYDRRSSRPARRNRGNRKKDHRLAAGSDADGGGRRPGETPGGTTRQGPLRGDLQQPAGEDDGHRRATGAGARLDGSTLRSRR